MVLTQNADIHIVAIASQTFTLARFIELQLVIQMEMIEPSESEAISAEVTAARTDYLEVPALGSTP